MTLEPPVPTEVYDAETGISRGTITALIGPTGSGKSTFLRTLNRMNDNVPSHRRTGDATLDGHSIFRAGCWSVPA